MIAVVNFADYDTEVTIDGIEAGNYQQWLNSQTIYSGPGITTHTLSASPTLSFEAKGYAVYVKQ